jgi:N-acyl homoserine lactone hydrolase
VQSVELATARQGGYTFGELLDFPGATYEEIGGEAEVWPGIWIIPTPGHTDGHQSLVIKQNDGTVILAGQARDFASQSWLVRPATSHHNPGWSGPRLRITVRLGSAGSPRHPARPGTATS